VDPTILWVAIAVVLIAGLVWYTFGRRRTQQLRNRFGPEYEHTLRSQGNVRKAEAELEARAKRVEALHIRPLSPADASRYDASWRGVQARFVDDPKGAVTDADRLVGEVMNARGYPVGDFEQRVADVSVDHPDVVMNYRAAREIAVSHAQGKASTEDLRQAMVHYRALFHDLLDIKDDDRPDAVVHGDHVHSSRQTAGRRHS
jgi:hypothetical protein